MPSKHLIGPFVRRFLLEDVTADRNLSPHTRKSYRDCLRLLFEHLATDCGTDPTKVTVEQVDATRVRAFLRQLEDRRGNSIATRNRRLAALRSLFRFIARLQPELVDHAAQVCAIPDRKAPVPVVAYLSRQEVESLLAVPNRNTAQGRRDYCLLLLLYNTGARASEATGLTIGDLTLVGSPCARFLGKGGKHRLCPLWPRTVAILREVIGPRLDGPPHAPVFLSQRRQPLTRFGAYELVKRVARKATESTPSLAKKRVSPIPCDTAPQSICCKLGSTSTRSVPGSAMSLWRPRIAMPKSTWRPRPAPCRHARKAYPNHPPRTARLGIRTRISWNFLHPCRLGTPSVMLGVSFETRRDSSPFPRTANMSELPTLYLHYVLDAWVRQWRQEQARGEVIIVRYADDFVLGFQHRGDAVRLREALEARLTDNGLALHPEKTRLIEFGRFAAASRAGRGEGKPKTFDFLGFTHYCGKTRQGRFQLGRKPIAKRMSRKLKGLKRLLLRNRHADPKDTARWLGQVLNGWLNYYAVPGSYRFLARFRERLKRIWARTLRRRSQKGRIDWKKLDALCKELWPAVRIRHPWPNQRFAVRYTR